MSRSCGVLLSITSLPSKYGIGSFSKEAYEFVDWLKAAGQTYWQILPLGTTSFGDSPYQSFSINAGNPYMISLDDLVEEGLLLQGELENADFGSNPVRIDYEKQYNVRYKLLRIAFSRYTPDKDFTEFCDNNADWLHDYALFMSIKDDSCGAPYYEWDEELKKYNKSKLNEYEEKNSQNILFHKFIQYKFFSQWHRLKKYANDIGIKIIGDIPIYVSRDSVDVWSNSKLFLLDSELTPTVVAGCPPDSFSKTGQLWGNPIYDWDYHKNSGFTWWKGRISNALTLYDMLRIDHFRGFDEYYAIPYGDPTAENGVWEKGPGMELFSALKNIAPKDKIIAEDLGFITETVNELVKFTGYKNMKIIEFGFDSRDSSEDNVHLPHNFHNNSVVYTATHDNQTLISWYNTISDEERMQLRAYLSDFSTPDSKINIPIIALAYRSVSDLCIIPMQDWLGLDDKSRMNTPSTIGENWRWRLERIPDQNLAEVMNGMAKTFSR